MDLDKSNLAAARWFARIGAITVATVGATVLVGWIFDITSLKIVASGLTSMKANTAIGFLAAGAALLLIVAMPEARKAAVAARALALVVALMGALSLAEYVFAVNLGIDQLLFHDTSVRYPGRMAPATAATLGFLGLALLALQRRSSRSLTFAGAVAAVTLFFSTLALIGYAYGVRSLYQVSSYASVSLHTALCFWLLSLSLLAAAPTRGFVSTFISDTSGGLAARQLIPTIPLILFAVGWVGMAGADAGLYQPSFGLSLVVILSMSVSVVADRKSVV